MNLSLVESMAPHLYLVLSHCETDRPRAGFKVGIYVGHGAVADADVGTALGTVNEVLRAQILYLLQVAVRQLE